VVSSKYGFRLTPVIVGSPAYLAGIRPGATLKAIDAQEPLNTQPLSELQALLNGKANTSVSVTFNDPLTTREQTVSVKRTWMDVPPVQVEISGSTAVVRIHALDAKSVDTIRQELSAADLSVVVLQMDAEPGGTVEGVVQLLSLLLPTDTPLFQAHSAGGSVSHKALGGQLFTKTIVTAIAANSPSTTLSGLVSQTLEQVAGSRTLHLLVQGSDGLLTVDPVLRDAQGTAVFPAWRSISGQSPTPTTASGKQRLEGAITFATSDLRDPLRTDVRKTERSQLLTDLATLLKTAK
jgi:membrane-associated protease RseP (regulator of RpoE activity)